MRANQEPARLDSPSELTLRKHITPRMLVGKFGKRIFPPHPDRSRIPMKMGVNVWIVHVAIRAIFLCEKIPQFRLLAKRQYTSKNARKFLSVIRMSSSE